MKKLKSNSKTALIIYILSNAIFGFNGVVASNISLNGYEIVFFRTFIGSITLLSVFLITGGKFHVKDAKRDLVYVASSGALMGLCWIFLYEGYDLVGVGLSSLLFYFGPVFVMMSSTLIFKEKITPVKAFGFAIVICGIVLINSQAMYDKINTVGFVCGLLSAVTYFVMLVLNKKSEHITGLENSVLQLISAFLVLAVFIGIKQQFVFKIQKPEWIWILILGIINTGLGCFMYFSTLSKLSSQTIAVYGYTELVVAVLLSGLLLHEPMGIMKISGAVCIVAGAVICEFVRNKKTD